MGQTLWKKQLKPAVASGYLPALQLRPLISTIISKILDSFSTGDTFQVCGAGDLRADSLTEDTVAEWLSGQGKGTRHEEVGALCCKTPHCTRTGCRQVSCAVKADVRVRARVTRLFP